MKASTKSVPYTVGDKLRVKVEKIVPKGLGMAFAPGLTVFVALAAPGDLVEVELTLLTKNVAFAEIVGVIEPSPVRATPPCIYFGSCGGCDFQQMTYQAQLEAKAGIIRDCLERIGKISYDREIPVVASPRAIDYRLRVQWHCDARTRQIGYFRRESHEVIDVDHCPIATPAIEGALTQLRTNIEWENIRTPRIEVEAANGDNGEISWYSSHVPEPAHEITITARGDKYSFSAETFFQGNQYQLENLIDLAVEGTGGRTAVDLFCGVGLFSLPLARRFEKVLGVEASALAIGFAKKNSENAGLTNISFDCRGVEEFVKQVKGEDVDLAVFDPPRSGTSKETIVGMLTLNPKAISYVSCEPSILARDLRWMLDRGYAIDSITGIDLFPQTHHVETVVRLSRTA